LIVTVLAGLFLLAIWLIEYDPEFQRSAATRLPVPVISTHALLAIGGVGVWVMYLITDVKTRAYRTLAVLTVVVTFGLVMAVRWVGVYRTRAYSPSRAVATPAYADGGTSAWQMGGPRETAVAEVIVPPERNFPVPVVIGHGLFAFTSLALVLITTVHELSGS